MAAGNLSQPRKRRTTVDAEAVEAKRARGSDESPSSGEEDDGNELVAGKVLRVYMKNFMCHDSMEIVLNPKINFIVGQNGSGKSAILTALTVALGAKASVTKRGPSVKEFIKKGRQSSRIEVTISNEGSMAYRYDTYGNRITIIRTLNQSGASTYTIKNWEGKLVSHKRSDLNNIVQFLNIQVDNPISILNQDVARSFLGTQDDTQKYQLFMRATRLDVISDNYRSANEASMSARDQLNEARTFLQENEKEMRKIEKKLKALASLDQSREEYQRLENEQFWAAVLQEEARLKEIDKKAAEKQKELDKMKNLEVTKAAKEQEIDAKIEQLKGEISQFEQEAAESNSKLAEIKRKLTAAKNACEEKKDKAKGLHHDIRRKESDVNTLKAEVQRLERESNMAGQRRQQSMQEKAEAEQRLDEVEASMRTKQTDNMHLEENGARLENEFKNVRIQMEEKRKELSSLKQRLNAFKNQSNDASSVYGQNMPRLLKRIDEEYNRGKFHKKPVGPIGSYIKMKDPSWIPAVESQLGGLLFSFCVDNAHDSRVLGIIFQEVYRKEQQPQVIISKFFDRVHDIRDGCTNSSRYANLFEAMEFTHPVVANCLIDQREIECALLIPTSEEACQIMSDARNVPRNCKRSFTKQSDIFYPDPQYRTYGGRVGKPRFLQVSTGEAIQALKEEISVVEEEYQILEQNFQEVNSKCKNNRGELTHIRNELNGLKRNRQALVAKIEECKENMEALNDNTINTFMGEIEDLQRIIVEKKETESHLMEEVRQSQRAVKEVENEYKECRGLAQNLDAKLNPIKDSIKDLRDEKNRLNVSNKGVTRRMEEVKQTLQQLEGEHQQQQRVVNSKTEVAESKCSRIEVRRSIKDIYNRLKELKMTIETVERQHGDKDALKRELEEKRLKYAKVYEFAVGLERSNDKQLERLRERKSFYFQMKREISQRVQRSFTNVLRLRNYKGKIRIDHERKRLELEVSPSSDGRKSTSDVKSLSGGERSYSTVAFVLALWDSTGLPFYFLDEFDVFMDKVNRRVIMDILLAHAKENPKSQFAFLTPQDTSHIFAESSITIHKLAAPERTG